MAKKYDIPQLILYTLQSNVSEFSSNVSNIIGFL